MRGSATSSMPRPGCSPMSTASCDGGCVPSCACGTIDQVLESAKPTISAGQMPSSQTRSCSLCRQPTALRDIPDQETINCRAVCGRTAHTVRRAGRAKALPDPYLTPSSTEGPIEHRKLRSCRSDREKILSKPKILGLLPASPTARDRNRTDGRQAKASYRCAAIGRSNEILKCPVRYMLQGNILATTIPPADCFSSSLCAKLLFGIAFHRITFVISNSINPKSRT